MPQQQSKLRIVGSGVAVVAIVLLLAASTFRKTIIERDEGQESVADEGGEVARHDTWSALQRTKYTKANSGEYPVEILHAVPEASRPKAIVMCFHGCTHSGSDWFTLPEEGVIVRKSLEANLAVVAVTSYDRQSGCWGANDLARLPAAFEAFREKNDWAKSLPIFTIGASSGGTMVSMLEATPIKARGIYLQIGRPSLKHLDSWKPPGPHSLHLLFMTKDATLKQTYEFYLKSMEEHGSSIARSKLLEAKPCDLNVDRLVSRIYDMRPQLAELVLAELSKRQIIDHKGFPQERTLYTLVTALPSEDMFAAIQEQVKVCYAQHELTAEHYDAVLEEWLLNL